MLENLPRARSEKDITRVSGTLSTGSIPVGRTTSLVSLADPYGSSAIGKPIIRY
jgi:hypothetical protein